MGGYEVAKYLYRLIFLGDWRCRREGKEQGQTSVVHGCGCCIMSPGGVAQLE